MDRLRRLGQLVDAREPLRELLLAVRIVETLRRGEPRLLPVLGVAAMEADDREPVVRGRGDRWDARRKALGLVDRHVAQAILPQELERLLAVALAHPRRVPELDGEAVGGALGPALRLVLGWQRVVRSVVLHEREASGVVAEALFRVVLDLLGIPAGCDERRVGPRARTHLHRSEGGGLSPPTTRRYPLPPTGTGPGRARRPSSLAARGPRP